MIETVRGPIESSKLGVTYIHEHLIVKPNELARFEPYTLDSIEKSSLEATSFKEAGGSTIVDLAPLNFGRDVNALVEIALKSDINVLFVTGFHKDEFIPRWFFEMPNTAIADVLIREIEQGVGAFGAKPAAIKIGTSLGCIKGSEARAIEICAAVARDLHVPMITHTDKGTMALEQLELLAQAGMDLNHVCVSHVDLTFDVSYLKRVCDTGASISFDHVGRSLDDRDARCVKMLEGLVRAGYENHVCLAGDMGKKSYLPAYGGTPGLAYILTDLRECLLEVMDESDYMLMLKDNPRRVLEWN